MKQRADNHLRSEIYTCWLHEQNGDNCFPQIFATRAANLDHILVFFLNWRHCTVAWIRVLARRSSEIIGKVSSHIPDLSIDENIRKKISPEKGNNERSLPKMNLFF